ncbi:universal stress protein [Pseudomonas oligotrophica]|uniref:universal stress protein n=1 Tax=Pseudomonas oligotrophica TaxID=2912055 RepID=UPI001F2D7487|nr:universal stress protein [Pseudomonas oligotrophica]MCF7201360.1 universal stress protein [Pseudomonas oligotrophica]
MVQHILVAHDLSAEADLALRRAAQLAQQCQARLSLVHVRQQAGDEQAAGAPLQARLEALGLADSRLWLRQGPTVETLLGLADGLEADLLVLGRHHRQSPAGFAGTTLEQLLLAARIPLLLVVHPAVEPYRRALAALDFSPCASRALQAAWRLLATDGRLLALNVEEMAEVHGADPAAQALQAELFGQLIADLRAELPGDQARLDLGLRQGERLNCLEAAIAELQPQLLALGSHSRSELSHALLGSLTRYFFDHPPCDVLVAR